MGAVGRPPGRPSPRIPSRRLGARWLIPVRQFHAWLDGDDVEEVVLMGFIRKEPSGSYRACWREPNGDQRSRTFPTKSLAKAHLVEVESSLVRGTCIDPRAGRTKFGPYTERWFASRNDEFTTTARTQSALKVHVLRRGGDVALAKIDHSSVRRWVTELGAAGRRRRWSRRTASSRP
jgi:hypothetical protein